MNGSLWVLTVIIGIAAYTDLRYRRIPNWLAVTGLTGGMVVSLLEQGAYGAGQAAAGAAVAFGLMLLLHLGGALGAGDVKLFAAVGAAGGIWLTLNIIIYSILFAGLIAVVFLLYRRQLFSGVIRIMQMVVGLLLLKRWELLHPSARGDMIRFPFLLAVIPGTAAALWEMGNRGDWLWML